MKQTILGKPAQAFRQTLRMRTAVCIALVVLTAAINLVCVLARTETNHTVMLWVNILMDILCGFFVLSFAGFRILPQRRLYALFRKEGVSADGTVSRISNSATRHMDMDCLEVTADSRRLFLPAGTITLSEGETYTFRIVSNVIVEAWQ